MTIIFCPRCNQRVLISSTCSDFVHTCNSGDAALDQEDVLKRGNWQDYTGSGDVPNANFQGTENELQGQRAGIEGERVRKFSDRGKRTSLFRQRQHEEFIQIREVD